VASRAIYEAVTDDSKGLRGIQYIHIGARARGGVYRGRVRRGV
jgi:hypothetical protein